MRYLLLTTAILCCSFMSWGQTLKGGIINGEFFQDYSGSAVSMPDANTIAVGARLNSGNGSVAGHVRIFRWDGTAWTQKGSDIDGEASGDYSGYSVSMPDSNTVAIGAIYNDGNGIDAGNVRVFQWTGISWLQKGNDLDGEAAGNQFGYSVSMPDHNTLAVGAPFNDDIGQNGGEVSIYKWNGNSWIQKGGDIPGEASLDQSGFSVSMPDSNTLAIGAPFNGFGSHGHVRIYKWNNSSWIQKGLDIDGNSPISGENSGSSVSMPDSNTIAIGSPGFSTSGSSWNYDIGRVKIFSWNGISWIQKGNTIDGNLIGQKFGFAVSMPNPNNVAIGAPAHPGAFGFARIYRYDGNNNWQQKGNEISYTSVTHFGYSISMPEDQTVAFGRPNTNQTLVFNSLCSNSSSSITVSACDSYTTPSGQNSYSSSGIYTDTILNFQGCDSVITINLTVKSSSSSTIAQVACDSLISPSGNQIWTISGTYTDVIPNQLGCDSIITVNLTINNTTETIDSILSCGPYTWIDGNTYTISNNSALFVIPGGAVNGCDSVILLDLEVINVNTSIINNSPTLTASTSGALYQWLDCTNAFALISGETGRNFTATTSGVYAVEVTENGCIDTSQCIQVTVVGIESQNLQENIQIFPNPVSNQLNIVVNKEDLLNLIQLEIYDIHGKMIELKKIEKEKSIIEFSDRQEGVYTYIFKTPHRIFNGKIIKM